MDLRLPPTVKSLSARLLVLTIFFVMLSEVLIYAPSIGRFRKTFLEERVAAAHLASLALEATPRNMVNEALAEKLLDHAGAYGIVLVGESGFKHMLERGMPPEVDATYDLREGTFFGWIGSAFVTLAQNKNRILRIIGPSPKDPNVLVEVIMNETPMRLAMYDYSERILGLSITIALLTATFVYLSLQWLMVRPMRRLTESMVRFREAPEDASRTIWPSRRSDEIGMAQRELAVMQRNLRGALLQKTRLAALGAAVTKINHDLRNILSTASLMSDRLAASDDPEVKRVTPTLMQSIDRAVGLCSQTLDFARAEPPPPKLARFSLAELVDDAGEALNAIDENTAWDNAVSRSLEVNADRDQLFRVLVNLGRNAFDAGARYVRIRGERSRDRIFVDIADDGPGIPNEVQKRLFQPFAGTTRAGGTGLGLAISREIVRAHGGDLTLVETGEHGTIFRLDLPATSRL